MKEKIPLLEKTQREEINLNKNLFNQLDEIFEALPENENGDKNLFKTILNEEKKKCFEYLVETLNFILYPEQEVREGEKKETEAHSINNSISGIEQVLDLVNIPFNFGDKTKREFYQNFKRSALNYAINCVLDYEKKVVKKEKNSEEILKEMNLEGVVDNEYLENVLIKKINELPVDVRDNLILSEEKIIANKSK